MLSSGRCLIFGSVKFYCLFSAGVFPEYKLPFEEEVGLHPSIDTMQDVVVEKKLRPKIRGEWRAHKVLRSVLFLLDIHLYFSSRQLIR